MGWVMTESEQYKLKEKMLSEKIDVNINDIFRYVKLASNNKY